MTEHQVQELLRQLAGSRLFVAAEGEDVPEAAWGDTFCYYDPTNSQDQKWPFATIVTHDTPGWDEASDLDRAGAFRLNLHVGRDHVPQTSQDIDFTEADVVLPHPQYATQGWVAIVNPRHSEHIERVLGIAHRRAVESTDSS